MFKKIFIKLTEVIGVAPLFIVGAVAYFGTIKLNSIYAQIALSAILSVSFIFLSAEIAEVLFRSLNPKRVTKISCPYASVFFAQTNSTPFFGIKFSRPHRFVLLTNKGRSKGAFMHECTHARFWYVETVNMLIIAFAPIVLGKYVTYFPANYFAALIPIALISVNELLADRNFYLLAFPIVAIPAYILLPHNLGTLILIVLLLATPCIVIQEYHQKILNSTPG